MALRRVYGVAVAALDAAVPRAREAPAASAQARAHRTIPVSLRRRDDVQNDFGLFQGVALGQ